jgi:hypothetical protein
MMMLAGESEFPLGKYREETPGSCPIYGYALKVKSIDPSG